VFPFLERQGLSAPFLRRVYRHQVELLARRFDALDAPDDLVTREGPRRSSLRWLPGPAGRALELAAQDEATREEEAREWDEWADGVGERLTEVDWDHAWR